MSQTRQVARLLKTRQCEAVPGMQFSDAESKKREELEHIRQVFWEEQVAQDELQREQEYWRLR